MNKHQSRRDFLKKTAMASALLSVAPGSFSSVLANMGTRPSIGLQLWSIRDDMNKDPKGTVEALAKMGYKFVEGFGLNDGKMFGMAFKDFVSMLKSNGITMNSLHHPFRLADYDEKMMVPVDAAKKNMDLIASGGVQHIVAPWMDEKDRPEIARLVKGFNAAGTYAKQAGAHFGYHNHNFEFQTKGPDGRLLIEWILQETNPALVEMEMDIYWVSFANYNPLDWFRLYPGRWKLCHVKDMANSKDRETIEVGDGVIDFNSIFAKRQLAGLTNFYVELEHYKTTPMEGVKKARAGFNKLQF